MVADRSEQPTPKFPTSASEVYGDFTPVLGVGRRGWHEKSVGHQIALHRSTGSLALFISLADSHADDDYDSRGAPDQFPSLASVPR
jgi:hypothetical protein